MTGAHTDTPNPQIGDLVALNRALQRRLTIIEHLCDEAETVRRDLRVDLVRAALESGHAS